MSAITIATRSSRSNSSTAVAIACSRIVVTRPPPPPLLDRRPDARTRRATRRGRARRRSRHPTRMRESLAAMSPRSTELERLSITISVRFSRRAEPACRIASQFEPSFSSASPVRTNTRCSSRLRARSAYATPTAIGSPCPSEPVEASTPGTRLRSGCAAEDPVPGQEALQLLGREEAVLTSTA